MANFFSDFWKVLKFDNGIHQRVASDKNGLWVTLRLFIVVSLVITFGGFVSALASEPTGMSSSLESLAAQLEQLSNQVPPLFADNIISLSERVEETAEALSVYAPPLGRELSYYLRAIGDWLVAPFKLLSGWMVASILVFLVAKMLKGKADLREHVSVFLLGIAPWILLVVSSFSSVNAFLGTIGGLLNIVAFIWSLAVVVEALKAVHGFSAGRAFLVLLLTFLLFGVLVPILGFSLFSLLIFVLL